MPATDPVRRGRRRPRSLPLRYSASGYFHARPESEDLRVTRRLAIPFRVLPWTILFDHGLGLAITFEADQYLETEGREDREEVEKPAATFAVFNTRSNDDVSPRLKYCRFPLFALFATFCSNVFSGSIAIPNWTRGQNRFERCSLQRDPAVP
jgi:hypothetical protein